MPEVIEKPATASDWKTPPLFELQNADAEKAHNDEHSGPVASIQASLAPNADPATRLEGAKNLTRYTSPNNNKDDYSGSHEVRWDDVFKSKDIGDMIRAFTGGADRRELGQNGDGTPVVTVYNGRGDVRRYEWANGEKVSPEDLQKLGPIASVRNISAERNASYIARGLSGTAVRTAMAKDWGDTLAKQGEIAKVADTYQDVASNIKALSKRLVPYSVNPAVRTFLAKVNTLTNDRGQQINIARDTMNRISSNQMDESEARNTLSKIQGVNGPLTFMKNKGIVNAKGEKASSEEINDAINKLAEQNSTSERITSTAQNLKEEAQLLAAQNKIENVDDITALIGLKEQAADLSNRIRQAGGIPGFSTAPNINHNLTDSFSLAHTNAEYNEAEARAAKAYVNHVNQYFKKYGMDAPDIGLVDASFSTSDDARKIRKERTQNIEQFIKENQQNFKTLNEAGVPKELQEQVGGKPVTPPTVPLGKEPPVARAEKSERTSEPKSTKKKDTSDVLNKLFPLGK
jgi:hypothetical protein